MTREEMIMARLREHYEEALEHFEESHIVGIWLQGSQNYMLDNSKSDIDTKLIVTPTFKDIALTAKPVSTTHIRANEEHIDFKDIRLYMECFRKQNLNFLEILFTPYFIINPLYEKEWNKLVVHREEIARMNPYRAVKSMKGVAMEKYHAMEHRYPSKVDIIDTFGYDCKQTHHLVRIDNFLTMYKRGFSYAECLIPFGFMKNFLMDIKNNKYILDTARNIAETAKNHIEKIEKEFCAEYEDKEDPAMRALLEEVSYNIMKTSVEEELKNEHKS